MPRLETDDEVFMKRALRLAARGRGAVEPNPMVGCLIVRNGRIIGEGFHRRFGGPHAEVEALRRCTESARGATAYVTLEPCCHHGQTPPCTDALLASGVRRVVAALVDPNPRVRGGGLRILRKAGVAVDVGCLREQAEYLNAPFIKLMRTGRPWVILKWAQSLDGKIATHTGDSKWITDAAMRAHAHRVRGLVDAIVVGSGTVRTDDPLLTCRVGRPRRVATRVVLDSALRTSPSARLVRTARTIPTRFFYTLRTAAARVRRLEAVGCLVARLPAQNGPALAALLDRLGAAGMTNVLIEGGGRLLGRFFDLGLADEVHIYVAPRLIGGAAAPGPLNAVGVASLRDAVELPPTARLRRLGNGWLLHARLHPGVLPRQRGE